MSRIRSIKPEFWTSAQILECSTNARLMFIGLWNFCDDAGRHPASAKQIKAEIFPADPFSETDVAGMLQELSKNALITFYQFENKEYFYVNGWKHQRIDKPQTAKYPDPFSEHSTTVPRTFPPDTIGEDKKGKDIRAVAKATRTIAEETFEQFWKAYPKRDGANPKQPARKKFDGAVRSGAEPKAIIAAARTYASQMRAKGQENTPYVAQAVTWLNQQRWGDYATPLPSIDGPKPPHEGLPTHEELKAKYENLRGQDTADGTSVPGSGDGTRSQQRDGLRGDHKGQRGNGGVDALLRVARMGTMGHVGRPFDED